MYLVVAAVLYLGFALLVGRFCSLNSRWERAVANLFEGGASPIPESQPVYPSGIPPGLLPSPVPAMSPSEFSPSPSAPEAREPESIPAVVADEPAVAQAVS